MAHFVGGMDRGSLAMPRELSGNQCREQGEREGMFGSVGCKDWQLVAVFESSGEHWCLECRKVRA